MSSLENQNYQQAMDRLESILANLDQSDIAIDELALQVQEASELLKHCKTILIKTEKEVQESLNSLADDFGDDAPKV